LTGLPWLGGRYDRSPQLPTFAVEKRISLVSLKQTTIPNGHKVVLKKNLGTNMAQVGHKMGTNKNALVSEGILTS
jgi:hypothetical protein